MINYMMSAGRRLPITAVAIALALAVVLSVLAVQGLALMTNDTIHQVVVQHGPADVGSDSIARGACAIKSSHTPRWCFSGSARRGERDTSGRTPPWVIARKA